jgi:DNA-binding SARP family transcriptional activator
MLSPGEVRMTTSDSSTAQARVRLRLAGVFAVARGAEPVAGRDLGSRKARMLLKLLAVERPRTVPVERITEVLWAGAPPARPAENIATFVSRLRRALGTDVIHGGRPGYRLGIPPAVQVDLDDAGRWAEEAERRLVAAEPALAVAAATAPRPTRAISRSGCAARRQAATCSTTPRMTSTP